MAYDSVRGVTVLFGGAGNEGELGDTWEWDGTQWTLRDMSGPLPRSRHAMVFDERRAVVVLFGGRSADDRRTWEWDGSQWTLRSELGPAARFDGAMVYDSRRGVIVLFSGLTEAGYQNDTWEWDGRAWMERNVAAPPARNGHRMAYDEARGLTVMFGGFYVGETPPRFFPETWEWDGSRWTQLDIAGPQPTAFHTMAYDAKRGVTLVHGGIIAAGNLWEFANCRVDFDDDGVLDYLDACLESETTATIFISDCDSGAVNRLFDDGCTMADRINECATSAEDHRGFVRCVRALTYEWRQAELITVQEQARIRHCAVKADIP